PEYQEKLFGDEVLAVDIRIPAEEWSAMMDNAQAKEWISCDITINGELFTAVGVRTKGNSSLSQTSGSDRYSLSFKFDEYVAGQNCYGLDSFCVNNMMGDATFMKDYISYDIMRTVGVEAPLTNYANVTVNGEQYCFGVALERYDKSYLDRAYNTSGGQLYSVKIQMGRRGDFEDMWQEERTVRSASERGAMGGGMGGFGGSGGGSLEYTDDEIASYSAIFDNPVFSKNSDKDKQRVIEAIKNLNEGTDLEEYFDVDEILRYFAAHNFVVNLDSYTSNMQQNYYLYERDGKLTVLPWDYGLAFGGFQSGDASEVVNFPIDTPVSGVSMEDRPLLSKLLEVPEYSEKYHQYLQEITDGYFGGGEFARTVAEVDGKIARFVEEDGYVTPEAYRAAVAEFIELGTLRAESVAGQLAGSVPSTSAGQSENPSALTDASGIDLTALGSMMGGRGGQRTDGEGTSGVPAFGGFPADGEVPEGFSFPDGEAPEGFGNFVPGGMPEGFSFPDGEVPEGFENVPMPGRSQTRPEGEAPADGGAQDFGQTVPAFGAATDGGADGNSGSGLGNIIVAGGLLALLAVSIAVVARPGRNTV
ncbi:MAG: CotH kinase family protein, partial [Oscillospiraceae bacterium]|nr:CotH kinase family protein [Oscillospiraceae bacterium]